MTTRAILCLSLAVMLGAYAALILHATTPGMAATPPLVWPDPSKPGGPTVLAFVHPKCPCGPATLERLAALQQRHPEVRLELVFVCPVGAPRGFFRGTLWAQAAGIPGLRRSLDWNGVRARRFGVQTSGQVLAYDRAGRLLFAGGVSAGRGHGGDNPMFGQLLEALDPPRVLRQTPVFGCELDSEVWCGPGSAGPPEFSRPRPSTRELRPGIGAQVP